VTEATASRAIAQMKANQEALNIEMPSGRVEKFIEYLWKDNVRSVYQDTWDDDH
jgi:hypothetical protein